MSTIKDYNLESIKLVAEALGELNEKTVFVGGAVVNIYADDPAADDVRPTKDIDITLEIATQSELEKLRQNLVKKHFRQSHDDKVMCRFNYQDIKVDVMSTKEVGWAPANEWFAPGFRYIESHDVKGISVNLLPVSYFLATKFSAFHSRGQNDPRTSHDFEDITYILNNRVNLAEEILKSPADVKEYLQYEFNQILQNQELQEAMEAHISYGGEHGRFKVVLRKLQKVVDAFGTNK